MAALAGCHAGDPAPAVIEAPVVAVAPAPSTSASALPSQPPAVAFVSDPLEVGPLGCALGAGILVCHSRRGTVVVEGEKLRERGLDGEGSTEGGGWEQGVSLGLGPGAEPFMLTTRRFWEGSMQGAGFVYRLVARAWVREAALGDHVRPIALHAWSQGRWLALADDDADPKASFATGAPAADLPRPSPAAFASGASAIAPRDFAALASGEVVMVGRLRTAEDEAFSHDAMREAAQPRRGAWERWRPGSPQGEVGELAWNGAALLPCCVRIRSPEEVWIAGAMAGGRGFVGAWDGRSWRFEGVEEEVRAFDVEPDGTDTAWIATTTRLARGQLGHGFETVPLPARSGAKGPPAPVLVWAREAGDVWVLTKSESDRWLYRTRPLPPEEQLTVSQEEERAREHMSDTSQRFSSESPDKDPSRYPQKDLRDCETPFVMITALPAQAPADLDHAAAARALRGAKGLEGARFIEFERGGLRRLGARVPSPETGRKLVAAIGAALGPRPQLVCFEPAATRSLVFDFEAGVLSRSGAP